MFGYDYMSGKKVVIVDYGLGNLFNVEKAFAYLNIPAVVSSDPKSLSSASAIVLPGVGAFKDGMLGLQKRGFIEPLKALAIAGKPILGICLGMQMLMEESFEMGHHEGLGLIEGSVIAFQEMNVKIPHMGWSNTKINQKADRSLFDNCLEGNDTFYFVHSYYVNPTRNQNLLASAEYGSQTFAAIVGQNNIVGCQFHPEKSGVQGLKLLQTFANSIKGKIQ